MYSFKNLNVIRGKRKQFLLVSWRKNLSNLNKIYILMTTKGDIFKQIIKNPH